MAVIRALIRLSNIKTPADVLPARLISQKTLTSPAQAAFVPRMLSHQPSPERLVGSERGRAESRRITAEKREKRVPAPDLPELLLSGSHPTARAEARADI